ncbi:MAG: SCO1664 family protein [Anaerolineales bacterium]|jgi:uncharacterized repeat protein (TIGR03843 family)
MMDERPSDVEILETLNCGSIEPIGQVVWGSNYTFLVRVVHGTDARQAIYKPARGERPLWDFPHGSLVEREVAAYLVSEALGWRFVPPTVLRTDAPAGPGSLQLYIESEPELHYFTFSDEQKERLRPVVLFDLLINNADRKAGHLLIDAEDRLWLIDHGVCFHDEPKLRTVIWDFVGEPIPTELLDDVRSLLRQLEAGKSLHERLLDLLSPSEITALRIRANDLLAEPAFPEPGPGRPYPWPLV